MIWLVAPWFACRVLVFGFGFGSSRIPAPAWPPRKSFEISILDLNLHRRTLCPSLNCILHSKLFSSENQKIAIESGCNGRLQTRIQVAASVVPNHCTLTTKLRSQKELRICDGCVVEKECTAVVGRKKHWPTVGRWRTTPNFKAAIDARCAMPTPPRLKRRAKLLNR